LELQGLWAELISYQLADTSLAFRFHLRGLISEPVIPGMGTPIHVTRLAVEDAILQNFTETPLPMQNAS